MANPISDCREVGGRVARRQQRVMVYLKLVRHDLEGQAGKGLLVIRLPGHLRLWVIHCCALKYQQT